MTTTVITGSGSGIGAATRERLESAGHEVLGVDLVGAEVLADLSHAEGRARALDAVLTRTEGRIDHLVVAAGIGGHLGLCAKVVAVNYFGAVAFLDGCFEALERGAAASAVAICSNSAKLLPFLDEHPAVHAALEGDEARALEEAEKLGNGDLAYIVSKNALGKAVRRRAMEWGRAGVRLNAVAPGPVETPLLQEGLATPGTGDAIRALELPLGRRGRPEEIASLIAWLLGTDAGFVHGSVWYIDGGMDAHMCPDRF